MLADAPLISASSSGGLIHSLMFVLMVGIAALLIWAVGVWCIGKAGAPGIVRTLWDGLFMLVGLVVVVNFLMTLAGHPLFAY